MLSFPLPQIVPKPYDLLSYVEQNILKNAGNQQLLVATDSYRMERKILWKSVGTRKCLVTNILQNIFFCVDQKKINLYRIEKNICKANKNLNEQKTIPTVEIWKLENVWSAKRTHSASDLCDCKGLTEVKHIIGLDEIFQSGERKLSFWFSLQL